jgi:hypothetical protein
VFAFATGGCGGSRCRHLLVRHGDRDTRRVIYLRTACVCVLWCHFGTEVFKRSGVILLSSMDRYGITHVRITRNVQ